MKKIESNLIYLKNKNIKYQQINFNELAKNINRDKICKTLVLKGDKSGILIVTIPFSRRLETKKLRQITKDKKIRFVENVEEITGYPHGANGPIGISLLHPEYKYFIDSYFNKYKKIVSNIGEYGNTVLIDRIDLIKICNATVIEVSK